MGPQSAVQKVADATTATGEPRAVAVDHWLDDMPNARLHDKKQCDRPEQHGPAGIDGDREREWERGSDGRADVRDEAQHCGQDAPQDRTWNSDKPQTQANDHAEGSV